jgi:hypothetical protein
VANLVQSGSRGRAWTRRASSTRTRASRPTTTSDA